MHHKGQLNSSEVEQSPGLGDFGDDLRNNIFPRSLSIWLTGFYVAIFIIRPWEQMFPWMMNFYFFKLCSIAIIIVGLNSARKHFQPSVQTLCVSIFLLAVVISGIFAANSSLSWDPLYDYVTVVLVYFVFISVIRTPYELVFIVICYIITMFFYFAKAQTEFYFFGQNVYDMGVHRLTGIENAYGGPNSVAMSAVVTLPFALFLWSARKQLCAAWPAFWRKIFPRFIIVYFYLAVSSIILTNSRSGMVAFILFVLIAALSGKGIFRGVGFVVLGILMILAIWQLIPEENKGRYRTIWAPETGPSNAQTSAEGRIEGYKAGMAMFADFPLTGVGIGNFINYRVRKLDGTALDAHNLLGQMLGETGLLGGVSFLLIILTMLANCRKVKTLSVAQTDRTLHVMAGLALASRNSLYLLLFTGLFGHNLYRFNYLWLAAFSSLALLYAKQRTTQLAMKTPAGQ